MLPGALRRLGRAFWPIFCKDIFKKHKTRRWHQKNDFSSSKNKVDFWIRLRISTSFFLFYGPGASKNAKKPKKNQKKPKKGTVSAQEEAPGIPQFLEDSDAGRT